MGRRGTGAARESESRVSDKALNVVCIGNAIVDVISRTDDAFLDAHGMVKGSMALIDDTVVHTLYADMPPGLESSGGSAANTAAGIASFGGSVGFIGKVADDQLGEVFTHDIRAIGVHYDPPAPPADQATARCLILVTLDAQRTLNTFLGASSLITPADVDPAVVASAAVVYCEGYLWDLPEAKEAMRSGMRAAHAAGSKVAFTLSDSFCVDRHRAEFLELIEEHVDILFGNEDEIRSLYEVDTFEEAADRVRGHVEIACLTRSEKGSSVITPDQQLDVPAAPADVIDTTGAGDLYAAGFLYGHTNGHDLETSARLGSLAAAEVISHLGARPEVDLADLAKSILG